MKVLVVDDSSLNLAIVKRYLENISDITNIQLCNDPEKANALMKEHDFDIMILDIIMPKMTGIEMLEQLKADPKYDDIPIIMLTSLNDLESYKKCFQLGAFDYINKPINVIEFNARLKVAIESKNSSNHLKSLLEVTEKQNEELKVMNALLTEAKNSLVQSEKMAAIGQLAAGIAHEINNPMGFVSSNYELLTMYFHRVTEFLNYINVVISDDNIANNLDVWSVINDISEKYKSLKIYQTINEMDGIFSDSVSGIQRITEIVQSLRIFARSSKDDEMDMNVLLNLIQQVILIIKNEIKYVATIHLEIPDDIFIYCNHIQIGQVFVNLILNAVQAIKSQIREELGLIKIIARKAGQDVIIQVIDDGPGIPEENILRIFEPFFTTKEIGQGTGLGLSISYDIIVNKHHGRIDVESEFGKGAVFTITLPLVTTI